MFTWYPTPLGRKVFGQRKTWSKSPKKMDHFFFFFRLFVPSLAASYIRASNYNKYHKYANGLCLLGKSIPSFYIHDLCIGDLVLLLLVSFSFFNNFFSLDLPVVNIVAHSTNHSFLFTVQSEISFFSLSLVDWTSRKVCIHHSTSN